MTSAPAPGRPPRNRGEFRRRGIADPAPLVTGADEVSRAAKVLAKSRSAGPNAAERSARTWAHIAALRADCERLAALAATRAAASTEEPPAHHPV